MPGLQLVTGPLVEPLAMDEVKAHLRLGTLSGAQETDLLRKLKAARRWVETRTGRALISQVWAYWFDAFPGCSVIDIPKAPILSIDVVTSYADGGVGTVFDVADYYVDIHRGRLLLATESWWPTDVRSYHAGVIQFTAGYGASPDDVPTDLVEAVAEMAGFLYYDREGIESVPQKVLNLVSGFELVAA